MSSGLPISEPACTARVRSPSGTVPAARSTPACCSASVMDWEVSPASASLSSSGVIVMRSMRAPESCASRTPSTSLSSGVTIRSIVAAACSGVSPSAGVTAIWMTGKSSMLPDSTWVSTESGSCWSMRLIARSTFCSVVARSTP